MTFLAVAGLEFSKDEVIIAITHGAFGSHAGIAFHSAKDGRQLLHLQFHQRLAVESCPPEKCCWIGYKPQLPPLASKQLVGIVRAIAKRKPSINYGVDFFSAKGSFDANGSYKPPKGSNGLTCATFVTEIFRAALLPLIKEETWTESDANVKWANDVANLLLAHKASEDHVAAVRASINGMRVRPEEVGAAGMVPFSQRPISYEIAFLSAPSVVARLHQICPLPPVVGAQPAAVCATNLSADIQTAPSAPCV